MQTKKFNISKPKKYTDRNGEVKTQWNNIGTITEFHKNDGSVSRIIEIPAIGLEASIFPYTEKNSESGTISQKSTENPAQGQIEGNYSYPTDDINPEDIPF